MSRRSCTRRTRCATGTTTWARRRRTSSGPVSCPPTTTPARDEPDSALRDLTPEAAPPHGAGDDFACPPTARLVARTDDVPDGPAGRRARVVLTDTATGETRVLVDDPLADVYAPAFSPDGALARLRPRTAGRPTAEPPDYTLLLVDVADGTAADLTADFDRWPSAPAVRGRRHGRLLPGRRRRPARDLPGARDRWASRSGSPATAPTATCRWPATAAPSTRSAPPTTRRRCRCGWTRADPGAGARSRCPAPAPSARCPGTLHEVEATAADGARVQSWLVLPEGASAETPAPLLLWIHGGPLMSWNAWSLALVPLGAGRPRVRRAAAQPGPVAGIRPRLRPARLGRVGRCPVHRPDGRDRRRRAAARHRRLPHGRDGRLLRRLHGQLGGQRRPTGSGRSSPTPASGTSTRSPARPTRPTTGRRSGATRCASRSATSRTRRTATPTPSARRCWSSTATRTTGCRSARRCGSGTTCRSAGSRRSSCTSPTRTTGCSRPATRMVWYETVLAFLAEHVLGEEWQRPELL